MSGNGWTVFDSNLVTWIILVVVGFSLVQGFRRGATGSVKQLLFFLVSAIVSIIAIILSAVAASSVSPNFKAWLIEQNIARPKTEASFFAQFGYTALSGLRDLPLFRFSALFLVFHTIIRLLTGVATRIVASVISFPFSILPTGGKISRSIGGLIGTILGTGRALLFTAVLFAYCALFPQGPMTDYIQQSSLYREVAVQVIRPATGNLLEKKLPVFAQAMTIELNQMWQKRYDVIDADLPNDIVQAAASITKGKSDDEAKARALYDWVGSTISYDNDKVTAYEEKGVWREQNPEHTFATRKGVCIDYARLYAAMARSVNLDVRVVTGRGYDGRGGYGPHAWNEVYLMERQKWIPLDSTWAKTGNWFDSPGFSETHIRQGGLPG
jgi:transglutaminase-like putative cysteine protease